MLHATGDLGKSGRVVREEVGYRDASHIKMKTCKPPTIVLLLLCPQLGWFWGEGIEGGGVREKLEIEKNGWGGGVVRAEK